MIVSDDRFLICKFLKQTEKVGTVEALLELNEKYLKKMNL